MNVPPSCSLSPAKAALLSRWRSEGRAGAPAPASPPPRVQGPVPLAPAQRAVWLAEQVTPGTAAYHLTHAMLVAGRLEHDRLAAALTALVQRHEVLRTTVRLRGGEPVADPGGPYPEVAGHDLREAHHPDQALESALELARERAAVPFDLERGPLARLLLVRLPDAELVVLVAHHLVADGWALGVALRDLSALYLAPPAGPAGLAPLPARYADLAAQQHRDGVDAHRADLAYWRDQLAGARPVALPGDRPRPAVFTTDGDWCPVEVGPELDAAVRRLARAEGATPYMVLLAALAALVHGATGETDVTIGSAVAGRDDPRSHELIGPFANPVAVRTAPAADLPFREFLRAVRGTCLAALAHQRVPFGLVAAELPGRRDPSYPGLLSVILVLQPALTVTGFAGMAARTVPLGWRTARADLELHLVEQPELGGGLVFRTDLFDPATARLLALRFTDVLRRVVADPDVPVGAAAGPGVVERALIGRWSGGTRRPVPAGGLLELVAASVLARPQAPAVVGPAGPLSYRALWDRVQALAGVLARDPVAPEEPVAVCLHRGPDLVVAALAVLRAGGCYLPLDPTHPDRRLHDMAAAAGARLVLVDAGTRDRFGCDRSGGAPPGPRPVDVSGVPGGPVPDLPELPGPQRLAYLISTSGSTGTPKGVQVTHGALANYALSLADEHGFDHTTVLGAIASPAFDASIAELFGPLAVGGSVCPVGTGVPAQPRELAAALRAGGVTALSATATTWRLLLDSVPDAAHQGLQVQALVGGEPVSAELAARLVATQRSAFTQYGPTETAVWTTVARLDGAGPVPLGRPIRNCAVHLLDDELRLVPVGAVGEVCVSGAGVARGYAGMPGATAERFVPDPFSATPGARMYRTGDYARRRADGSLQFAGRRDEQVTIRGHRVELGEVEAALAELGAVAAAAAAVRPDPAGEPVLVAYLVRADGAESPDADLVGAVRRRLRDRLPGYLLPERYVLLDALPTTGTGKLDRTALPDPGARSRLLDVQFVAPRTALEAELAEQVAEFLELDRVGVRDDFFELGAQSVRAAQLAVRLQDRYGVELVVQKLFGTPTVEHLAELIEAGRRRRRVLAGDGLRVAVDSLSGDTLDAVLAGVLARRPDRSDPA